MRIRNTEIKIFRGDITTLKCEAIVNAANNKLLMGGGVAGAIKKAAGDSVEKEAVAKGPIQIGEAIFTSGGNLKVKYVIHAATMGMDFKTDEDKIRASCKNAFRVAEDLNVKSIAFPALGCGVGAFPLLASAKIMAQEVLKHLRDNRSNFEDIIFCLKDDAAFNAFNKGLLSYLEYFSEKMQQNSFVTVDAIIDIDGKVVLIKRSNPPFGWAIPGGFLDYNESVEDCAAREAKEETGLDISDLEQMHTYSKPGRDPRFHTVTVVFTAKAKGVPKADSDAIDAKLFSFEEVKKLNLAFDHQQVLEDYFLKKYPVK